MSLYSFITDLICLGGYAASAYFWSELSFKSFMAGSEVSSFLSAIECLILPLAVAGLVYCAPKSKILAIPLVGYGIFRFYCYCVLVLSGETENEKLAEFINIAHNYAGGFYTIGAWISIIIAFFLYAIMCFTIFVPKD